MRGRFGPTRVLQVGILAIVLVACARSPAGPAPDPKIHLPGFRVGPVSVLSLDDVASDALDRSELAALLQDGGFAGAAVRAYSAGVGGPVRTVRIEIVAFDHPAGANEYLTWLHEHASEFIGDVQQEPSLAPPGGFTLSHAPSGCCSREQPVWLTAWRKGADAIWMQVLGPDLGRERVAQLVDQVRASV